MALYVKIKDGFDIKDKIISNIRSGIISTWEYDKYGDFTHVPYQWRNEAWMSYIDTDDDNNAKFGIVSRNDRELTKIIYSIYHGRFAEMLLTHFDSYILHIIISSKLVRGVDIF